MYEGLDTVVLYEELAYEDVLPVAWSRLPEPFDPALDRQLSPTATCACCRPSPRSTNTARSKSRTRTRRTPPTSCGWT